MEEWVFAGLRLDSGIVLDSPSPYEAEPTIATLEIIRQWDSDELEISWTYLDRWSTVEVGGDVVPFTTVDPEHENESIVLVIAPRSSFDARVESLSPSLECTC